MALLELLVPTSRSLLSTRRCPSLLLVFESPWINVQKQLGTLFGSGCSNMAWFGSMFSLLSTRRNMSETQERGLDRGKSENIKRFLVRG